VATAKRLVVDLDDACQKKLLLFNYENEDLQAIMLGLQ